MHCRGNGQWNEEAAQWNGSKSDKGVMFRICKELKKTPNIKKRITIFLKAEKLSTETSQKMKYKYLTNTLKSVQHTKPSRNCKSKLH